MFDVLAHHPTHAAALDGAQVLDLFAGSGAMAIEALSRGAERALMVEQSRVAAQTLRRNVSELDLDDRVVIWQMDAQRALRRLEDDGRLFDLVFLDPPYAETAVTTRVLSALAASNLLASGAVIVLEHAAKQPPPAANGLSTPLTRRWGETEVQFFRHE